MRIDYKDVRFSFRDRKIKRRRRLITVFFLLLLVLASWECFSFFSARRALKSVETLLLGEQPAMAEARLKNAGGSIFFRKSRQELEALAGLLAGRPEEAQAKLKNLGEPTPGGVVDHAAFCKYFLDRALYRDLKLYTDYLQKRPDDRVLWYRALGQAALLDTAGATTTYDRISLGFRQDNAKAFSLLQRVISQFPAGRITYIFDRRGAPLASFDLASRTTRAMAPGIRFPEFDADFRKGLRFYHLTLDRDLQEKVARLFSGFFGSFVLFDLKENGIMVAFSKPRQERSPNPVWSEEFEPGSIIKVLTLLAYCQYSRQEIFPFQCRGPISIGGHIFFDSLAHGEVRDFTEATTLSCNLAFARMGLAVGYDRLAEVLEKFFFNGTLDPDLFLRFQTGRFRSPGNDPYRLANLSVGIDEISVTTLHAALIAALIAQDGAYSPPYLIDHESNILDLGVYNHPQRREMRLAEGLVLRKVRSAMRATVEHEKGTARRAKTEGVSVAVKTGTAGRGESGLDAIVIGFFPFEDPQYAFAFRLEGGGRADLNGAYLLKNFLASMAVKRP